MNSKQYLVIGNDKKTIFRNYFDDKIPETLSDVSPWGVGAFSFQPKIPATEYDVSPDFVPPAF